MFEEFSQSGVKLSNCIARGARDGFVLAFCHFTQVHSTFRIKNNFIPSTEPTMALVM